MLRALPSNKLVQGAYDEAKIKVMIVGAEGSGKTCLAHAATICIADPKYYKKGLSFKSSPTDGISISRAVRTMTKTRYRIWDFAGAEIYSSTHSLFLTEKSVYVICVNLNSDFDHSGVQGWYSQIACYAPNSPILIVGTHLDVGKNKSEKLEELQEKVNEKIPQKGKKGRIAGVYALSTTSGKGLPEFVEVLLQTLDKEAEQTDTSFASQPNYLAFFSQIQALKAKQRVNLNSAPIMEWDEIVLIMDSCKIPEKERLQAVKHLESIGQILYFPGFEDPKNRLNSTSFLQVKRYLAKSDSGIIILDLNWMIAMFSSVVCPAALRHVQGGIISLVNLKSKIWGNMVPIELHKQLLSLLQFFDIIFALPGGTHVFIPCLLEPQLPSLMSLWPAWSPTDTQLSRVYTFGVSPVGIFARFMIRLLGKYEASKCWKTGILIDTGDVFCLISLNVLKSSITVEVRSTFMGNPVIIFVDLNATFAASLEHGIQIVPNGVFAPCPSCLSEREESPHHFLVKDCELASIKGSETLVCGLREEHVVPLQELVPEITMSSCRSRLIDASQITIGKKLAEGGFATVFLGEYQKNPVAVKIVRNEPTSDDKSELKKHAEFRLEVGAMMNLNHPNLLSLLGFALSPATMVLELIDHGDLGHFLNDEPKAPMDWKLMLRFANDIARGMAFMHSLKPKILHCDLKTPNVMLKALDWQGNVPCAKVCDFGVSKPLCGDLTELKGQEPSKRDVANPAWLAPEVLRGEPRGVGVDIYAFGIILWELLCRAHPWPTYAFISDHEKDIINGVRPTIPDDCPADYSGLMKACWNADFKARPSFSSIVDVFLPRINQQNAPELIKLYQALDEEVNAAPVRHGVVKMHSMPNIRPLSATVKKKINPRPSGNQQAGWKKHASVTIRNRWAVHGAVQEEQTAPGVLCGVSENLWIMPFPEHSLDVLLSDLEKFAPGYTIFNLSGKRTDYSIFSGVVLEYPLSEGIPSMATLSECVASATSIIKDGRPVVLHDLGDSTCASFLVAAGVLGKLGKASTPHVALVHLSKATNNKPTFQPEHSRFLGYLFSRTPPKTNSIYHLHKIAWNHIPNYKFTGGCDPHIVITTGDKKFFFEKSLKGQKGQKVVDFMLKDLIVAGQINVEFFHKDFTKPMFSIPLDLAYEADPAKKIFAKKEIGLACADTKHFHNDFQLDMHFLTPVQLNQTLVKESFWKAENAAVPEWDCIAANPVTEEKYKDVIESWAVFKAEPKTFSNFFVYVNLTGLHIWSRFGPGSFRSWHRCSKTSRPIQFWTFWDLFSDLAEIVTSGKIGLLLIHVQNILIKN